MLKLWKRNQAPDYEEVFLDYYSQTFNWALQITENDPQKAEDLVHDVFIQLALTELDFNEIDNLKGYIYAMLRNLMRSKLRRESRNLSKTISLEEYESAEIGLGSINIEHQLHAREELRSICRFLCERKETSKGGSALLLRYFLGYFRNEIQLITRSSESAVDYLLSTVTREVRLYLDKPHKLNFIQETSLNVPNEFSKEDIDREKYSSIEEFLQSISEEIFRTRQGKCFSAKELRKMYDKNNPKKIKAKTLAHIVSCPNCLDKVNETLGLPKLRDRFPTDAIDRRRPKNGPKTPSGGDGMGGDGGSGDGEDRGPEKDPNKALNKFRRRLEKVRKHEPSELLVAVNGLELGVLAVNSRANQIRLHIEDVENIRFIEVFSEQNVRLFFKNIFPPPEGSFEQKEVIKLSDDRFFELDVNFHSLGAKLEVSYYDPTYAPKKEVTKELMDEVSEDHSSDSEGILFSVNELTEKQGSLRDFFEKIRLGNWLGLRGYTAMALVSAILIAALIFIQIPQTKVVAAELINKSIKTETALVANPEIAVHRVYNVEQRNGETGELIERQRMDVWQSSAKGLKIRRFYDNKERLILADWQKTGDSRILYRPGNEPAEVSVEDRKSDVLNTDELWNLDVSANEFRKNAGVIDDVAVEETPEKYLLKYEGDKANKIVRVSLTLNREDLRAIEYRVVKKIGEELREFRFFETKFEQPKLDKVPKEAFEVEPELTPKLIEPLKTEKMSSPAPVEEEKTHEEVKTPEGVEAPKEPTKKITKISEATNELEVKVVTLLSEIDATLGEEVTVTRQANRTLRVEGLVSDTARKNEILAKLKPVRRSRAVSIKIETYEEAQRRVATARKRNQKPKISIGDLQPDSNNTPISNDLRQFFKKKGISDARVDAEVKRFSNQVIRTSNQAKLYAWTLRNNSRRFSPQALQKMDPTARKRWFSMIATQSRNYRLKVGSLQNQLSPVVGRGKTSYTGAKIATESQMISAIQELNKFHAAINSAVTKSFTLSGSKTALVKNASFRRSVSSAISLAKNIEIAAKKFAEIPKEKN